MKRSNDRSRLLGTHGNRANLTRHSKAQISLVRSADTPATQDAAPISSQTPAATKRWQRRRNTH